MNLAVTQQNDRWVIEAGAVELAALDRHNLSLDQVRFHTAGPPLLFHWQLRFTVQINSPHEPVWDYAHAHVAGRIMDARRAELHGQAQSTDGALHCQFALGVALQEDGHIVYDVRQSLQVRRNYVLADHTRGWFPTAEKNVAFLEYTNPYFLQAIGPATPFTRDCPEMSWPLPIFFKDHQRWWHYTTYTDVSGELIAYPNHHVIRSGLLPVKTGGFVGLFHKPDGPNPVLEIDPSMSRPTVASVCDLFYDLHLGHLLPVENGRCILRAGDQFEAVYRVLSYEGAKAADVARRMRLRPVLAEEFRQLDVPAYHAGVNAFSESLHLFDDSLPWRTGLGGVWDKEVGRSDRCSLRIESNGRTPAQWEIRVGRDFLFDPLVEGATYRLRAWVKTVGVSGNGVRIGLGHGVARFPGVTGETHPIEYRRSQPLGGSRDWTLLEVTGLPVPRDTLWAHLILQLDGAGKAWFDEVEFSLEEKA